ncbi:hypothetical protein C0Q70_02499 [Pomacea canaliculata]|uniref:Uncharacterized protein n=1 Tax=Pomacea canaliculata TaxID=400727 RepID=A0A2T7PQ32_POMCA|nr:hypothetical protein C0Q70_02499 [Pomacea canaliculata]
MYHSTSSPTYYVTSTSLYSAAHHTGLLPWCQYRHKQVFCLSTWSASVTPVDYIATSTASVTPVDYIAICTASVTPVDYIATCTASVTPVDYIATCAATVTIIATDFRSVCSWKNTSDTNIITLHGRSFSIDDDDDDDDHAEKAVVK